MPIGIFSLVRNSCCCCNYMLCLRQVTWAWLLSHSWLVHSWELRLWPLVILVTLALGRRGGGPSILPWYLVVGVYVLLSMAIQLYLAYFRMLPINMDKVLYIPLYLLKVVFSFLFLLLLICIVLPDSTISLFSLDQTLHIL